MTSTARTVRSPHTAIARRMVTVRAVAIACALMPLLSLWVVESELVWYSGHSTAISLFSHVVTPLFLLALLNLLVARRWPRVALAPGELMTIYVMWSVAGTLCSHDLLQVLLPLISFPTHYANPQNRWAENILPFVRPWALVTDAESTAAIAVGNASIYQWSILKAWLRPLCFWSLFLMTLMAALLFMVSLFRQPWTEKERLSFPVIQIPLMIATRLGELLRNRLFWCGFGMAAFIDLLNGISALYPAVPSIPVINVFRFADYFTERPWNALVGTELNLYPFAIGFAFLLPTDLAFSCWFFFLLFKLQLVLTAALGMQELPGFPFPAEQSAGGYIALGLLAIWLARRHFAGVVRTVLGRPGGVDESREPMRYRTMLLGFVLAFMLLVAYGMALGASMGLMMVFFAIFFLYALAISRMRAELGPPAHDLHFSGPELLINNAIGTSHISKPDLGVFTLFYSFNRAYRAHFAAHGMEAYKIAQSTKITARSMMVAMLIALVTGLVSSLWALLHALYLHGYSGKPTSGMAAEAWTRMESWVSMPEGARVPATIATLVGVLLTFALGALRTQFTWWVWHPVGYVTCSSWSMNKLWACLFIAWAVKALVTRYGGAKAYQYILPFFVGLLLGEFCVGSFWCTLGALLKMQVYQFWG